MPFEWGYDQIICVEHICIYTYYIYIYMHTYQAWHIATASLRGQMMVGHITIPTCFWKVGEMSIVYPESQVADSYPNDIPIKSPVNHH